MFSFNQDSFFNSLQLKRKKIKFSNENDSMPKMYLKSYWWKTFFQSNNNKQNKLINLIKTIENKQVKEFQTE